MLYSLCNLELCVTVAVRSAAKVQQRGRATEPTASVLLLYELTALSDLWWYGPRLLTPPWQESTGQPHEASQCGKRHGQLTQL